jgi:hypothetical protein
MGASGQLHALAAFVPGEITPGNQWIGGLVGLRAGLDAMVNRNRTPGGPGRP